MMRERWETEFRKDVKPFHIINTTASHLIYYFVRGEKYRHHLMIYLSQIEIFQINQNRGFLVANYLTLFGYTLFNNIRLNQELVEFPRDVIFTPSQLNGIMLVLYILPSGIHICKFI